MRHYEHGGDIYGSGEIILDFSVNLNPLGMPAEIKNALFEHFDEFAGYPDSECRKLSKAISVSEGVPAEYILCGNGAADLIYRVCFGLKPDTALVCAPTFSEYERAVLLSGGKINYHMLDEAKGFAVPWRILYDVSDKADIVFLCNPNNPTGRLADANLIEDMAELCEKRGSILFIDECFLDFTNAVSSKWLLDKFYNVVILKAFTKTYAMAGLRLGYMMSRNRFAMDAARDYAQAWSVSAPAQAAGIAALKAGLDFTETRRLIAGERKFLADSLAGLGLKVYPSDANFLLLKSDKPLKELLLKKGVLVRSCANFKGLDGNFTRICVSTRDNNEKLISSIKEVSHG